MENCVIYQGRRRDAGWRGSRSSEQSCLTAIAELGNCSQTTWVALPFSTTWVIPRLTMSFSSLSQKVSALPSAAHLLPPPDSLCSPSVGVTWATTQGTDNGQT